MWRGDEAQLLKVRHDIADGRRAEVETRFSGQRSRSNGLTLMDVAFDQHLQEMLGALIQRGKLRHNGLV